METQSSGNTTKPKAWLTAPGERWSRFLLQIWLKNTGNLMTSQIILPQNTNDNFRRSGPVFTKHLGAIESVLGAIESILTQCISVWYKNATNQDCKALQRVVRLAERISGSTLLSAGHLPQTLQKQNCKNHQGLESPNHESPRTTFSFYCHLAGATGACWLKLKDWAGVSSLRPSGS